jgi:hypothetical protein
VPVDVREATPYQRLRASDPNSAAIALTYGRQEMDEPVWPREVEVPSGKQIAPASAWSHLAIAAHEKKQPIKYTPAPDTPLDPVEDKMTIRTAVSPDCGLDTLSEFLASAQSSLVVGMYDFTSGLDT